MNCFRRFVLFGETLGLAGATPPFVLSTVTLGATPPEKRPITVITGARVTRWSLMDNAMRAGPVVREILLTYKVGIDRG